MNTYFRFCSIFLLGLTLDPTVSRASTINSATQPTITAGVDDTSTSNLEYQADLQNISELQSNHDLNGLNLLSDKVKKKYEGYTDKTLEYRTLASLASAIESTDFGIKRSTERIQNAGSIAAYILGNDGVPLDVAAGMLRILNGKLAADHESVKFTKDDWAKERSNYTGLWLTTLGRFDQAIGPSFDPHMHFNVDNSLAPPSPDPAVNAQHAAARKAATQKANAYDAQHRLYMIRDMLVYDLVRDLGWAYSQNPQNTQDLQGLFKQDQIDPAIQAKVLAAVAPVPN